MRFLVTGYAGFIGFHVAKRLLDEGHEVIGLDGFTEYYDVRLKERRSELLVGRNGFQEYRFMLEEMTLLENLWAHQTFDGIIHLAGQAGVRYSLENPRAYVDSNIVGTFNLLEMARQYPVRHFMLASTSSVYGANSKVPFEETDQADNPLSIYAATKKSIELMSHNYSHLWDIPVTAFRFFTVYGPWGRPDMAAFKFTHNILNGVPIDVYNNGELKRDFTYVDDLVEAIWRLHMYPPKAAANRDDEVDGDSLSPQAPWRTVNIGGGTPVGLLDFIKEIEKAIGRDAICNFMAMQPGDAPLTYASSRLLQNLTAYKPSTPLGVGIPAFVDWYRDYLKS